MAGASILGVEMGDEVALVHLRLRGASWWAIVSSTSGASGVGLLSRREQRRARAFLEATQGHRIPARLVALDVDGLTFARGDVHTRISVARAGGRPLREAPCDRESIAPAASGATIDLEEWALRGENVLAALEQASLEAVKRALLASIAKEQSRLTRRTKAVLGDLAVGHEAEAAAEHARLFVPAAARATRGTTRLTAEDWASGEPIVVELALDAAKRPQEQLDAIFARARRLARGRNVALARIEGAREKTARLSSLAAATRGAASFEAIATAREEALREDPALLASSSAKSRPETRRTTTQRTPYRTFVTTAGARILVGRGASDNDELTLHVARPYDLWLHAKGEAGAHVVVPLEKGHEAASELLVDAAHLAAHFSDARDERVVDVTYAPRRYVRKRRGSPPGQVQVDREKVLVLRVDSARLAALLARETRDGATP